nr:hypothetical protein B0A51_07164 [Rachicladosporium sp. CCFEE 5018]
MAAALPKFSRSTVAAEERWALKGFLSLEDHSSLKDDSDLEQDRAVVRRKSSKPAEEPPKGTYWLEHPDADDPVVQHPKYKKPWTWYPGIDTQCFVDIDDDENGGNKCAAVDGHFLISAVFEFCTQMDGELFSLSELHTSYMLVNDYWPSSQSKTGERGSILLQVGFARDIDSPKNYTMDYTFCVQNGFLPIVNHCDNKGFNNKRGGIAIYNNENHGNDHLFWLIDPNPIVPSPYNDFRKGCNNRDHYVLPDQRNTAYLPIFQDPCRDRWNENYSPREWTWQQRAPFDRPPWDCSPQHVDGSNDDTWDWVGNDRGSWPECDGNVTFPEHVLLDNYMEGNGWTADLGTGGAGWVCTGKKGQQTDSLCAGFICTSRRNTQPFDTHQPRQAITYTLATMKFILILAAIMAIVIAVPTISSSTDDSALPTLHRRGRDDSKLKPGTVWLEHPDSDNPHMHPRPRPQHIWNKYPGRDTTCYSGFKGELNLGENCSSIDGHWFVTAIDRFCGKIDGRVLDATGPKSSYKMIFDYWPSSQKTYGERGSILLQVGFTSGIEHPLAYTMDYDFCVQKGFMPIVNYCDNKSSDHKRGGFSVYNEKTHKNDDLTWIIDPNPIVPTPYKGYGSMCNNKAQTPYPLEGEVEDIRINVDRCRQKWNELIGPREG